ncbi:MAG: glutamate synthase-related protein [Rubripirellula sp.]
MCFASIKDAGLDQDIVFTRWGKLGFPETALLSFSLGCVLAKVGREAKLAIGCIQTSRCHPGPCPTGVATQNRWPAAGLAPTHKANRFANYVVVLRKELLQ